MWSGGSEAHVYLSRTGAILLAGGAATRFEAASWEEAWAALLAAHGASARRLRVHLSASLARPFLLPVVAGLRDRYEAEGMADGLAAQATGHAGPCATWLDQWSPGQPCLAVAVERELVEIVTRPAGRKAKATSLGPAWNLALTEWLGRAPSVGLLCIEEADGLTVLVAQGADFTLAQSHCPPPDDDRVDAQLLRLAMSQGITRDHIARASLQPGRFDGAASPAEALDWKEPQP